MTKKLSTILFLSLLLLPLPAQSEGISLQKDILLGSPIFGPEDLPEEITFTLYDSQTAATPLGYQTFTRGQYTVDFEFSKSNGITAGNVARVSAEFTKTLNLKDAEGEAIQPKELWAGIEVGGAEIGDRTKVSDETLVQLLLASDASIATYLTLAYTGDDNPIATIYKDLPISSSSSDGSGSSLINYFSAVAAGSSSGVIEPNAPGDIANWREGSSLSAYYNAGNVGIGTSTPNYKLDLRGSFHINADAIIDHALRIYGNTYGGVSVGSAYYSMVAPNNGAIIQGNVGIGTASPARRLTVASLGAGIPIFLVTDSSGNGLAQIKETNSGHGELSIRNSGVTETVVLTSSGDSFFNGGNVGIGTSNPTYKLCVNGTIRAKEIIVDTGWSDFVFEDSYGLPPLTKVEQFIQENKHLPGIPTEAEVKEKGVSLGDISSKLLQKIEELTLYVIGLKKENDSLKSQLTAIQKQVNDFGE